VDDVLGRIAAALGMAGVPYMLTGSYASSIYGTGRATYDVDFVIDPTHVQLHRFVALLPTSEYYVDLATALDSLARRSQFNVVDLETSWKADLIIRKDRPFSITEFARRIEAEYCDRPITIATAEDIILAKLEWAKQGGSRRQVEDAAGILKARRDLDRGYLDYWVAELGIENEWRETLIASGVG
jgi:hypothetical protein